MILLQHFINIKQILMELQRNKSFERDARSALKNRRYGVIHSGGIHNHLLPASVIFISGFDDCFFLAVRQYRGDFFSLVFSRIIVRVILQRQGKVSTLSCAKRFPSIYFAFCFFKTIPHTIAAAKKIKIRYHKFSKQKPLSSINRYPQEAGETNPIVSKKSGRNSMGNIIPESIIEGKNTNWAIIVSFA